jgi:membrane-associated phospholipid phosphatase
MNLNIDIFYLIQDYIHEKPYLESLIVFVARHVPTIIIALVVGAIIVRLIPREMLDEMKKGRIGRVVRVSVTSLLAALVLFFRRYVFGIQSLPRSEDDGLFGRMMTLYATWIADMLIRIKVHIRFLMDIFVAPCATLFSVWIAKLFFGTLRPFELLTDVQPLFTYGGGDSFPSGHAAFFASVSVVLLYHYPGLGIISSFFALAIGLARIASGIHFPADIIGGFLLGIVVSLVIMWIHHRKFPLAFSETLSE